MGFVWSLFIGSPPSCNSATDPGCFTNRVFSAFAQLHGVPHYDEKQASRLQGCFERFSTSSFNLQQGSDAAWKSFAQLGVVGAGGWGNDGSWAEYNPTPLPVIDDTTVTGSIIIAEPCNAVSNFAFYRASVELCEAGDDGSVTDRAIFLAMSSLAFGSAFYHSGVTAAGSLADNKGIQVIALILHQNAVSSLPYSSLLYEFSESSRSETSVEAANKLARILAEQSGDAGVAWTWALRTLDLPPPEVAYSGFIILALNLIFDENTATSLARTVGDILLTRFETSEFIFDEVLPVVRSNLADIHVPFLVRADLFLKTLYAFLWQENFIDVDIINGNFVGNAAATPIYVALNALANSLTRNKRELSIQTAFNIYPGDLTCRLFHAHSKSHEFFANALVDMYFLSKDLDRVLRGGSPSNNIRTEDLGWRFPGCQGLADDTLTDDEKMTNLADCFVSSTPLLYCLRDCTQGGPTNIASCLLDCLLTKVV